MVTFDQVLEELLRICDGHGGFDQVERSCVVRDLRGRVRLVLKPRDPVSGMEVATLEDALEVALGRYFVPPIWATTDPGEKGRLAKAALDRFQKDVWDDPSYEDPITGTLRTASSCQWLKHERRLTKEAWLDRTLVRAPWPLGTKASIVTFFSFKGGVGRTTALASCAWQLARARKQVAIVDLDLEAPGLGVLMGARASRGVLDFVLDFLVAESRDVEDLVAPAQNLGAADAAYVDVVSAGRIEPAYLEKLARLDYIGAGMEDSRSTPVERALVALLHALCAYRRYDYILFDSRAGLHDLAGLSLHGLAHVVVVVGRATEDSYQGLDLTLQLLSRRKGQDLLCVLVHGLAPMDIGSLEGQAEVKDFRSRSYESFAAHVYEEPPDAEATDQPHYPRLIRRQPVLEHFSSLSAVEGILFSEDYRQLLERVEELCLSEEGEA